MKAYESGRDEPSAEEDEERRLPALDRRPDAAGLGARAAGPRDEPAGPLHRGEPREGARGPRDRPPVDVRVDHGDDPRPRLRLQEGHGARADVRRVLGHAAPREALRPARRLRLHGPARGRPRPDRRRERGARRVAPAVLLRQTATPACTPSSPTTSRGSTRATSTRSRSRAPTSSSASAGTARTSSAASSGRACPTTSHPTSSAPERAEELLAQPAGAERALGTHPETGREIAARTAATAPT